MLGTGDAVQRCREAMAGVDRSLSSTAMRRLLTAETVQMLVAGAGEATMAIAVNRVDDRGAFGRVEHDAAGRVRGIVEAERDGEAAPAERNAGFYASTVRGSGRTSRAVATSEKGERYLTALAAMAAEQGTGRDHRRGPLRRRDRRGRPRRLAEAEAIMRRRIAERLHAGRSDDPRPLPRPTSTPWWRSAEDVTIEPGCHIRGRTPRSREQRRSARTRSCEIAKSGARCLVTQSTVEDSRIGNDVHVGPNAHVRGGASIGDHCELGNYAEVKNSVVGEGVKMHHFSYLGDADVGAGVNYRRRRHHLQLRRREQAPDNDRGRRLYRLRHDAHRASDNR